MPYIPQKRRDIIHNKLTKEGSTWTPSNAGDLNYLFSTFIDNYLVEKGIRYAYINEMIGALECCKIELYRKIASPYEDQVIFSNGEVYYAGKEEMGGEY